MEEDFDYCYHVDFRLKHTATYDERRGGLRKFGKLTEKEDENMDATSSFMVLSNDESAEFLKKLEEAGKPIKKDYIFVIQINRNSKNAVVTYEFKNGRWGISTIDWMLGYK